MSEPAAQPRYAIYLAPPPDSALCRFGSAVLGYDAATGAAVEGFSLPGIGAEQWRAGTARPRSYGFHATLKAPFRLAEGQGRDDLVAALSSFAALRAPFDLGPLAVTSLKQADGGFAALTPRHHVPALAALEEKVVKGFDSFRAPLSEAERAARRPDRLSPAERDHLENWGYPHVLDLFRFHMTLTGFLANPDDVADLLADELANQLGTAHLLVDALVLFEQPGPGQPFRITHRAAMGGA